MAQPKAPTTNKIYNVTVLIEGQEPFRTQVTASRDGQARTRAMISYFHTPGHTPLAGQTVDYVVEEA
jgi:acyl-CoA thioesterase